MSQDPARKWFYRGLYSAIRGQRIGDPPPGPERYDALQRLYWKREEAVGHIFLSAIVFGFIAALIGALFLLGCGVWFVFKLIAS